MIDHAIISCADDDNGYTVEQHHKHSSPLEAKLPSTSSSSSTAKARHKDQGSATSTLKHNSMTSGVFGKKRSWVDHIVDEDALHQQQAPTSSIAPVSLRPAPLNLRPLNASYEPIMIVSSQINGASPSGTPVGTNSGGTTVKFVNSTVEILQNQIKKEEAPKKKRTRTTPEQLRILQKAFSSDPMPNSSSRLSLAKKLGMNARAVQVWFQNRRAKGKLEAKRAESSTEKRSSGLNGDGNSDTEEYYEDLGLNNDLNQSELMSYLKNSQSQVCSSASVNYVGYPEYLPLGGILEGNEESYNSTSAIASPSLGSIDFASSGYYSSNVGQQYLNTYSHMGRAYSFGGVTGPFFDYASQDCGETMVNFADNYPVAPYPIEQYSESIPLKASSAEEAHGDASSFNSNSNSSNNSNNNNSANCYQYQMHRNNIAIHALRGHDESTEEHSGPFLGYHHNYNLHATQATQTSYSMQVPSTSMMRRSYSVPNFIDGPYQIAVGSREVNHENKSLAANQVAPFSPLVSVSEDDPELIRDFERHAELGSSSMSNNSSSGGGQYNMGETINPAASMVKRRRSSGFDGLIQDRDEKVCGVGQLNELGEIDEFGRYLEGV